MRSVGLYQEKRNGNGGRIIWNWNCADILIIISATIICRNFYVDARNSLSRLLLDEKNVSLKNSGQKKTIPRLLVTGSGFMVNSRAALRCELIWFLRRKHVADYCIGCNIEPIKSRLAERLVIHKLKKFKSIICRDRNSLLWATTPKCRRAISGTPTPASSPRR